MKKRPGDSILLKIIIVSGVMALLVAIAFPAIRIQRLIYQEKEIYQNLQFIADTTQKYFNTTGAIEVTKGELIAFKKTIEQSLEDSVAGEDYNSLFPIDADFLELSVTKADGNPVIHQLQLKY